MCCCDSKGNRSTGYAKVKPWSEQWPKHSYEKGGERVQAEETMETTLELRWWWWLWLRGDDAQVEVIAEEIL